MSKINGYTSFIDIKKTIKTSSVGLYTGGTSVVKLNSVFIPANTFSNNEVLNIDAMVQKENTLNLPILRFYWNTSDTLSSAILLATADYNSTWQSLSFYRRIAIRTANGTGQGSLIASPVSPIEFDYSSFNSFSIVSINWTVDSYILLGASTNPGTTNLRSITLKIGN